MFFKKACEAIKNAIIKATTGFEKAVCYITFKLPQKGFSAFWQIVKTASLEKRENNTSFFKSFKYLMGQKIGASKKQFVRFAACMSAAVVLLVVGATSGIWTELRTAVDVNYNGTYIGRIASADDFTQTLSAMKQFIVADDSNEIFADAEFKTVITMKNNIQKPEELVEGALENTDGITEAFGLYANETLVVACEDKALFSDCMEEQLAGEIASANIPGASAEYVETVDIKKAYYSDDVIKSGSTVKADFATKSYPLTVSLTVTEKVHEEIPFETVKTEDSNKVKGYKHVTQKGVKGVNEVISKVSYVGGVEVARTVLSSEKISEPVSEMVTVGTAVIGTTVTTRHLSSSGTVVGSYGFVWPVAQNPRMRISSYYGDGRNHKGFDITSPEGTDIYSVLDGVVTAAGYNAAGNGFGYCVVVRHANGMETLYAHCSALYVSAGDVVRGGQAIAAVGSTGQSTGNHLHFEVRIGGSRVDPAPYLGVSTN